MPVPPKRPEATSRSSGAPRLLSAGPIRCRFADGELRYLAVGDKEIVRRVYFAVRDKSWDTIPARFTRLTVHEEPAAGGFTIELEALCQRIGGSGGGGADDVDYRWKGRIVGTRTGEITFEASGSAGKDFASNRIGLCVLYGAPSLVGQAFETVDAAGAAVTAAGAFPALVSGPLVAPQYQALSYRLGGPGGMTVRTTVTGARFDMEDQRTYGDSSFKAYAPLPYAYPNIPRGVVHEQSVTIRVENAPPVKPGSGNGGAPTRIRLGQIVRGAALPRITMIADPKAVKDSVFGAVNNNPERSRGAQSLTWGYKPSVHLFDDDTFRENLGTIVDQVRTARSYAPDAQIRIAPIHLDPSGPRPARDPRNAGPFGAAWAAALVRYLSLAGVAEAEFALGPGYAERVLKVLAGHAGRGVYAATVSSASSGSGQPAPVEAFAVDDAGVPVLFLVNLTEHAQPVRCEGLPGGSGAAAVSASRRRFHAATRPQDAPVADTVSVSSGGGLDLALDPFEVCEIRLQARP